MEDQRIVKMVLLYVTTESYRQVGKEMNLSPATILKYVKPYRKLIDETWCRLSQEKAHREYKRLAKDIHQILYVDENGVHDKDEKDIEDITDTIN